MQESLRPAWVTLRQTLHKDYTVQSKQCKTSDRLKILQNHFQVYKVCMKYNLGPCLRVLYIEIFQKPIEKLRNRSQASWLASAQNFRQTGVCKRINKITCSILNTAWHTGNS